VEERKNSWKNDEWEANKLKEERLKKQISKNYDDNVKWLIDVKKQLQSETDQDLFVYIF
jgi:hypothetical protein